MSWSGGEYWMANVLGVLSGYQPDQELPILQRMANYRQVKPPVYRQYLLGFIINPNEINELNGRRERIRISCWCE
jgi:hypothetical protein